MNGPVDTPGRRRSVDAVSELRVIRAGLVPYQDAWRMQRELHEARVADAAPDTVLLLQHPPVYTAGKRTEPGERPLDGTPVIEVDRGGKITWHGPGQLVGYPIIKLPRPLDVVAYVRRMERLLVGRLRRVRACRRCAYRDEPGFGCRPMPIALSARLRRSGFASRGE